MIVLELVGGPLDGTTVKLASNDDLPADTSVEEFRWRPKDDPRPGRHLYVKGEGGKFHYAGRESK